MKSLIMRKSDLIKLRKMAEGLGEIFDKYNSSVCSKISFSSSAFPIKHSTLDVRCSMFIFFSKPSTVHPVQKQLSAYGLYPL